MNQSTYLLSTCILIELLLYVVDHNSNIICVCSFEIEMTQAQTSDGMISFAINLYQKQFVYYVNAIEIIHRGDTWNSPCSTYLPQLSRSGSVVCDYLPL